MICFGFRVWDLGFSRPAVEVVGERSVRSEATTGRFGGAAGSENVGLSSAQRR